VRRPSSAILLATLLAIGCGSPGPTATPSAPAATAAAATPSPSPAATLVPVASAPPSASPAATPPPSPSDRPKGLTWVANGLAENTGIKVPLDYADPSAGTITLAVSRRPAGDQARRIGTLFINPGGPGGPGFSLPFWGGLNTAIPQAVLDRFDIVAWDPRGVGLSGGLTCPDSSTISSLQALDPNPSSAAALAAYHRAYERLVAQCQSAGGSLLRFMSEANTARDMDAIRAALGETTISYLGWSYGTYLGYLYATRFPTRLRAAVLDGPVDPTLDLLHQDLSQARGFEAALRHFLTLCAADTSCAFHGGDNPAKAYDALMARLRTSPQNTTLDAGHAVLGVVNWLYRKDLAGLATALASAERGDGTTLRDSADSYYEGVSLGAYAATLCLDDRHPTTAGSIAAALAEARQASPRFGAFVTLSDLYGCLDWPVPAKPVVIAAPPAGLPPIVVVAGRWDPATPPWGAPRLAKALGTGVVLTRDGVGHTSGDSATLDACLQSALTVYLNELTPPKPGTVCKDEPVSFKP
jgi:pimeloyl-ACP methyl ester carboxylesterase